MNIHELIQLTIPDDRIVCDELTSHIGLACLAVSEELGLFEHLEAGEKTSNELAKKMNASPLIVEAVANMLVCMEWLSKSAAHYALTESARFYKLKSSFFFRQEQLTRDGHYNYWYQKVFNAFIEGWSPIKDGKFPFVDAWGQGSITQTAANAFTAQMHKNIAAAAISVVQSSAFQDFDSVMDVAGGSGIFVAALKAYHPEKRVMLVELPQVCEASKILLSDLIDTSDIEYHGMNMFTDSWPKSHAVFMSNILHDWSEDQGLLLLNKAFGAVQDQGSVFIYECLLDDERLSPSHTVAFDVLMKVNHKAQQFTQEQLFSLLKAAGFVNPRRVHRFGYYSLIQANKA